MFYLKYLNAFIDEAYENVRSMDRCLRELKKSAGSSAPVNELFRSAHTLKASALSLGFDHIAELAHGMENVLLAVLEGRIHSDGRLCDVLTRCENCFRRYLEHIADSGEEGAGDCDGILNEFESMDARPGTGGSGAAYTAPQAHAVNLANDPDLRDIFRRAAGSGRRVVEIRVVIARECVLKAARAYITVQALEKSGEIIRLVPGLDDIENDRFGHEFTATLLRDADAAPLDGLIAGLSDIESYDITEIDGAPPARETAGMAGAEAGGHIEFQGKTVRVDFERLDLLRSQMSGLNAAVECLAAQVHDCPEEPLGAAIAHLALVRDEIGRNIYMLHTAPMFDVYARLPQLCADLMNELGKHAELTLNDGDLRCDINYVSCLTQSLIHILRNSVDHGVESPEEREAAGKPAMARITVSAFYDGGELVVVAQDDGAGVNLENARRKAVAAGIFGEEESYSIPKDELIQLIFLPMFTTRDQVSLYSGRGIGMDVVKARTDELGGTVSIDSEERRGTKITIRLPQL